MKFAPKPPSKIHSTIQRTNFHFCFCELCRTMNFPATNFIGKVLRKTFTHNLMTLIVQKSRKGDGLDCVCVCVCVPYSLSTACNNVAHLAQHKRFFLLFLLLLAVEVIGEMVTDDLHLPAYFAFASDRYISPNLVFTKFYPSFGWSPLHSRSS